MSGRDTFFPLCLVAVCFAALLAAACGPGETQHVGASFEAEEVAAGYIEAYNDRDLDRLSEIIAPSLTYGGEDSDREELLAAIQGFWEAFPDLMLEPTHVVADDEWAAIRIEFRGTHEGEFAGIGPTGETVEGSEIMLFRVRDRQIAEYWYEWDELGFYEQLGALEGSVD